MIAIDHSGNVALPTFEQGMAYYDINDPAKAAAIWAELAGKGDVNALFHLSMLYESGRGVPQCTKTHCDLLLKAFDHRHPQAINILAGYLSSDDDSLISKFFPTYDRHISGILCQAPTDDILLLFPIFTGRPLQTIGKESLPDHYQPNYPLKNLLISYRTRKALALSSRPGQFRK